MDQKKIIKVLGEFFSRDTKRVLGVVVIGSFGRNEGTTASDVDMEIMLTDEKIEIPKFADDIVRLFNVAEVESLVVKHTIWLADQRKLALYHGPKLLLTELYFYYRYPQLDKYFLGSRIFDLSDCILVDRDGTVREYLHEIIRISYDDRDELITNLIGSVQYHLESSSSARRRSDAYKFYFLSNIALHELVRLAYVLEGKWDYNYNPPHSDVASSLTSTMDLDRAGFHLKNLVNFFRKQLDRCEDEVLREKARAFCQDLLQRD
ncbi:hypothetical protein Bhyg_05532 [Pseudolycoriella hygida]|uniref:Polymerase nucleotidyl transferase domain-containing protein n=1 Tax=Pseudolycoriella hygida TaxID=35572 RepID=A0A9Q0MZU1_9DIPT|nr:hypothetical protein Bhyg_05532 [Pseudolycoriella hygida]